MNIPDETLKKLRDAYIAYELEQSASATYSIPENERYLKAKLFLAVEDVLKAAGMEEHARLEIFKHTGCSTTEIIREEFR